MQENRQEDKYGEAIERTFASFFYFPSKAPE
jgi:hypothetical protein